MMKLAGRKARLHDGTRELDDFDVFIDRHETERDNWRLVFTRENLTVKTLWHLGGEGERDVFLSGKPTVWEDLYGAKYTATIYGAR